MAAVSKAQRRFFGWEEHHPEEARSEGKSTGMTHQQLHDFASTKETGLPERKGTLTEAARKRGQSGGR